MESKMTIVEAIKQVMKEAGRPISPKKLMN